MWKTCGKIIHSNFSCITKRLFPCYGNVTQCQGVFEYFLGKLLMP